MVKERNLPPIPPLLNSSALLACILPHCRLRDWNTLCGKPAVTWFNASTNQRHSAFLIPHFTFRIPHFTHSLNPHRDRRHCKFIRLLSHCGQNWLLSVDMYTGLLANKPHVFGIFGGNYATATRIIQSERQDG